MSGGEKEKGRVGVGSGSWQVKNTFCTPAERDLRFAPLCILHFEIIFAMFREELISAIRDYRWLLDKNYPQRSSLHIVGDRYKLTGAERSILYRGVGDSASAKLRSAKLTSELPSAIIAIDCYNVLFTLMNYLMGKPVYISDDGFVRDAGEGRGRINNKKIFDRALKLLKEFILDNPDKEYYLLLDAPISNSAKLALELFEFLKSSGIKGIAETLRSPDYVLQNFTNAILCSGDSVIIDRTKCKVFDLPGYILKRSYKTKFDSISLIFN